MGCTDLRDITEVMREKEALRAKDDMDVSTGAAVAAGGGGGGGGSSGASFCLGGLSLGWVSCDTLFAHSLVVLDFFLKL
jgi:hypothetical protein